MHLPAAVTEPDLVISAVLDPAGSGTTPVLSLYVGCKAVLRTLSSDLLLHAFLTELRSRALTRATDRIYLQMPAVHIAGAGILLPPFALRRLVSLERAAKRAQTELLVASALTIDLKTGKPVPGFASSSGDWKCSSIASIEAIAVEGTSDGRPPTRAEVLSELARSARNLHSVGGDGLEALGLLVEHAELVEWDATRPQSMIECLTEKSIVMRRAS